MAFSEIIQSIIIAISIITVLIMWYEGRTSKIVAAPTLPHARQQALQVFLAHLPTEASARANIKIADLGCGWGGMAIALAQNIPTAHIYGFEISSIPYLISKIRSWFFSGKITISRDNFLTSDLSEFDVIYCYLSPYHMNEIAAKVSQLKKGCLLVSNSFPLPGHQPIRSIELNLAKFKTHLFVYKLNEPSQSEPA